MRRGCFSYYFTGCVIDEQFLVVLTIFLYCWCYRWAAFRQHIREIDDNAKFLCTNQLIKYQQHVGGRNVSVTSGFQCVDFHQFYMPYGGVEVRPTKKGIAFCICEWIELLRVVQVTTTHIRTSPRHFRAIWKKTTRNICRPCSVANAIRSSTPPTFD